MDRLFRAGRVRGPAIFILLLASVVAAAAPPQVMLTLSRDEHYFHEAYDDLNDLDGDGKVERSYDDRLDYDGYFHPHLCYDYSDANQRFEPAGVTDGSGHRHYCSGAAADKFSGNFLNWATMTRLDLLRRAVYGGKRTTDTSSLTVLERAALPSDAHSFAKYYNGDDLALLTPFDTLKTDGTHGGNANGIDNIDEGVTLCNVSFDAGTGFSHTTSAPPVLRIVQNNRRLWAANERWQCTWEGEHGDNANSNNNLHTGIEAGANDPPDSLRLLTVAGAAERVVRVVACDPTYFDASDNLEHCRAYPAGNRKPAGVVQEYGESGQIDFGLLSGSWARNHSGGVLRKNVGPVLDEIAASSDGHFLPAANGGLIAFLDTLRVWGYQYADGVYFPNADDCSFQLAHPIEGRCAAWGNPQNEMYFETLRYFAGDGAPLFSANDSGYFANLVSVGWQNGMAPGAPPASINAVIVSGSPPSFDDDQIDAQRFGTNTLAGLAGYAHTHDLRPAITGAQTVTTYAIELRHRNGEIVIPIEHSALGALGKISITPINRLLFNNTSGALMRTVLVSPHREVDPADRASAGTLGAVPDGQADIIAGVPTVNFPVAKAGTGLFHAKYLLIYDDTSMGADYDQDVLGTLDYVVDVNVMPPQITVTTKTVAHSTINPQLFGFTIRGTTQDGFHAYSGIQAADFIDASGVRGCTDCTALNETGGQRGAQSYTFTMAPGSGVAVPALAEAARWGGFSDSDGNGVPNLRVEWDRLLADGSRAPLVSGIPVGDGVPDNYFALANSGALHDTLARVMNRILQPPVLGNGDADDLYDDQDNCPSVANNDQRDTDHDGHGNICDADLNNDGFVNLADLARFKLAFGTRNEDADFNGDGFVNLGDLARFKQLFGKAL